MKDNKLIAEFMELPFKMRDEETKLYYKVCEIPYPLQREHLESTYEEINLKYHTSWDWLMPVVEKMNTTELCDEYDKSLDYLEWLSHSTTHLVNMDINATYNAVVEFINRYNKNK